MKYNASPGEVIELIAKIKVESSHSLADVKCKFLETADDVSDPINLNSAKKHNDI